MEIRTQVPKFETATISDGMENLIYQGKYVDSKILQTIIDMEEDVYVLKHMGCGFTYGVLNLVGNIVIAVPNVKIVQDKEKMRKRFKSNTMFLYKDSQDKKKDIPGKMADGDLRIMCTIDQLTMIYETVVDFVWIFDETHTLNTGAGYRGKLAKLYPILKAREGKTIQVTATPPLTVPDIFRGYRFINLINKDYKPLVIDVTYNVPESLNSIREKIDKGEAVAIFSNSKTHLSRFMDSGVCEAVVGEKMKHQLTQFDSTGRLFRTKDDTQIFLHTTAGVEGGDIYTNKPTHTFVLTDVSHQATSYTLSSMFQAAGRARNGNESITWIVEKANPKYIYEEVEYQEYCAQVLTQAQEFKRVGSEGKILSNLANVYEDEDTLVANTFGMHGLADMAITNKLFIERDVDGIQKIVRLYGGRLNSFNTEVKPKWADKAIPIRNRIDNVKRLGIFKVKDSYHMLHKYLYPLSPLTTSENELKVVLCSIYELENNTVIPINEKSPHVNRFFTKMNEDMIDQLEDQFREPIYIIKRSVYLYKKFKVNYKRGQDKPHIDVLRDFWEWFGSESHYNKKKWLKAWNIKDYQVGNSFDEDSVFFLYKKSAATYNKTLFHNGRLYLVMYQFGVLHRDRGLVKHRTYAPHVRLSMEQVAAITHGDIIEMDITSAYPQFIDRILGSEVGLMVYENLMQALGISRKKAKVEYNKALNKSDDHKRRLDTTLKIYQGAGYTPEQSKRLYELTKIKGEIYLILTSYERDVVNQMIRGAGELPPFTRIVRRHDSVLIIGNTPKYLYSVSKSIAESMEDIELHFELYNFINEDKELISRNLSAILGYSM